MGVYKVKEYKIVKGQQIKKTKEEYNRETCKGTKCWYFKCTYKDAYGNTKPKKSKKFATKEEAKKAEAEFLVNNDNKERKTSITFEELYNTYFFLDKNNINRDSSLYTKESRIRRHVLPYFKDDDILTITSEKIKSWKNWLTKNKTLCLRTRKSIFNTFSSVMQYAKENCALKSNPLKLVDNFNEKKDKIQEKEEIRFITDKEYALFINEVDNDFKVLFHFLYETGCRKGELQARKWNDINFTKKQIRINTTLSTKNLGGGIKITPRKNNKVIYLDMSDRLYSELLELYNKMKVLDGFSDDWFIFGGIKHISAKRIDSEKDKAFAKVPEVKRITVHEFRHSCASYMISNGIPIEIIAYRLGDEVETIRKTYAHLFPDTQKETVNLFEKLGTV